MHKGRASILLAVLAVGSACGDDSSRNDATDTPDFAETDSGADADTDADVDADVADGDEGSPDVTEDDAGADADADAPDDGADEDGTGVCTIWAPEGADGCPAGSWCEPDIFHEGEAACEPIEGTASVDQRCDGLSAATRCGAGVECAYDWVADDQVCVRYCEASVSTGSPGATCDADQICRPLSVGGGMRPWLGICDHTECTPWGDPATDRCDDASWCYPNAESVRGDGICISNEGTAPRGGACDDAAPETTCAPGLACPMSGTCELLCDVAASAGSFGATCPASELCVPYAAWDDARDVYTAAWVGDCQPTECTPWIDPGSSGCAAGEWCAPLIGAPTEGGLCESSGVAARGETCDRATPATTCAPGLYCGDDGECILECVVGATAGTLGAACPADEICYPYGDSFSPPAPLGNCRPSCDFHAGVACTDSSMTCYMGETLLLAEVRGGWPAQDLCLLPETFLAPDADCDAAGLDSGHLCGANATCFQSRWATGDETNYCIDICVPTTEHPFDTSGHPDCRNAAATCTDVGDEWIGSCL
jgi:hypothetical protein